MAINRISRYENTKIFIGKDFGLFLVSSYGVEKRNERNYG